MNTPIFRLMRFPRALILLLVVIVTTTLFARLENVQAVQREQSAAPADGDNQPPVLGNVGRDGAYGYSQTVGSGMSFSSRKELPEEAMEEGLAEFRSGMHVVWLYYSAEASDPEGDEVRYIWSQVSPEEPVAIIDQDDEFVPSGQAEKMKLCVPPSGAQITLQVVAMDKSGAKSEPKSVVVNDAGCASKERWAQLSKFAELRESANQGDPRSHKALAYAYINGTGVWKNEETGVDLMRTYAEQGNAEAQTEWAYFLHNGKHRVKRDRAEGLKWYRLAADQGHSHAQYVVGIFVVEDKQEAMNWLRLSAEQNHTRAQFDLAKMLAEGDGVPRDLAAANEWMRKSADQGHQPAKTWMDNWEVATAFNESGNRPPHLTSVTYTGDERPTSLSYSADSVTYKDGKLVTEGGKSRVDTIVWRKFTVRAEDFDGEAIRYLVTQVSPDTPQATIGGQSGYSRYHATGNEVMFAACFPQISGGEFTFEVIAEDKRGARSDPLTIVLEAIRSERCS